MKTIISVFMALAMLLIVGGEVLADRADEYVLTVGYYSEKDDLDDAVGGICHEASVGRELDASGISLRRFKGRQDLGGIGIPDRHASRRGPQVSTAGTFQEIPIGGECPIEDSPVVIRQNLPGFGEH